MTRLRLLTLLERNLVHLRYPSLPSPNKPPSSASSTTPTGIRRYIRAKQKLIALLELSRSRPSSTRLVTGQIDVRTGESYPAYKPSGVEWLGEVPEHWRSARSLKVVLKMLSLHEQRAL